MLEITYAADVELVVEVEITGTLPEICELEKALINLSKEKKKSFMLQARTDFVPKFNDGWIKELILMRTGGDVRILAAPPDTLTINGSSEKLDDFSRYFHFEDDDKYPTHHHCEWREDHSCLDPLSVPLVISIADENEEAE